MRAVRLRLKLSMPLLRSLGFWFSEYLQIRRTYGAAETGSGGNTTCQGEGARAAGDTGEHGRKGVTFPSDVSDVSGGSRDAADQIRGGSRCGFGNIFRRNGDQSAGTDSHGRARTQEARDGLLDYWIGGAEDRLLTRAARLENVSCLCRKLSWIW